MAQLTARSSTIFIATGEETRMYRSVDDVPPALRRKLTECTHGLNSATILIADKRGREELVRALQGRPSEVHCRLVENIRSRQSDSAPVVQVKRFSRAGSLRTWLELLLPVAVGASLWFFIESHF
ncbi:MAG TPA: hypothetical protein VK604_08970 [Bryobacteraceae bacterium]|nr:hypothetical protein [Bryobacteraceae bacterium]